MKRDDEEIDGWQDNLVEETQRSIQESWAYRHARLRTDRIIVCFLSDYNIMFCDDAFITSPVLLYCFCLTPFKNFLEIVTYLMKRQITRGSFPFLIVQFNHTLH